MAPMCPVMGADFHKWMILFFVKTFLFLAPASWWRGWNGERAEASSFSRKWSSVTVQRGQRSCELSLVRSGFLYTSAFPTKESRCFEIWTNSSNKKILNLKIIYSHIRRRHWSLCCWFGCWTILAGFCKITPVSHIFSVNAFRYEDSELLAL